MSGHSHFKNIKRKKEALDRKKALTFAKISRLIISSVREKGKDTQSNSSLRIAVLKAKEADMPKEKIERAIMRGAGEGEEGKLEPFIFEAYGPNNTVMIIEGSTDNKRRSFNEIRDILKRFDGKIADPGSVKWLFSQKGVVEVLKDKENASLFAIEAGAEDMEEKGEVLIIYSAPEDTDKVKTFLEEKGVEVSSSYIGWKPLSDIKKEEITQSQLLDNLEEEESVEKVYLSFRH